MNFLPLPTNLLPYWFFPWNTDTWPGFTRFIYHKELLAVDAIRQIFIWKDFAFALLKQGVWPLWNPYNFSGQPLLANFQSSVFYPLSWFFFLPSHLWAWTIYIYVQPFLAGFFMYLFLRGKRLSRLASLFGCLGLIFSSYFATRYFWGVYIHSLLWLPLGLWLIDRFLAKRLSPAVFLALLSLVLALSILGGYPQHGVFVFIISAAYFLIFAGIRRFGIFVAAGALAVFIAAVQILPTLELYRFSVREGVASKEVFAESLLEPKYLLTIFSPDIFGSPGTNNYFGGKDYSGVNGYFGIIPLAFAVFAVYKLRANHQVRFWLVVAIAGLAFSYKTPISHLPEWLRLPILSSGGAWNNLFFWQFGGVILSAYGLNEFERGNNRRVFLALGMALAVVLFPAFFNVGSSIAFRNTMLATAPLVFLLVVGLVVPKITAKLALLLLLVGGSYYLQKVSPFGERKYFYPPHPLITFLQDNAGVDRYWGVMNAKIASNFATYYHIYSPEGYDSLWPRWYGELIASGESGEIPTKLNRADIFITDEDNWYRHRLLSLLGVKYILDRSDKPGGEDGPNLPKFPLERYSFIRQWGEVAVYENRAALPRAYLADSFLVASGEEAVRKLYDKKIDLGRTLILEEDIGISKLSSGSARIVSYQPHRVVVDTYSSGPSLLFLSDTYFPGWEATVNGRREQVLKADYAFRAVTVPEGQNRVEFSYDPPSFRQGLAVSLGGLLIWAFLLSFGLWPKRRGFGR